MSTRIEWTDETWNPTLGCTRVSTGCDDCYAIRTARIRASNPHPGIAAAYAGLVERTGDRLDWTGRVNVLPERLAIPSRWRRPRRIFVDSQTDLFHAGVPDEFIAQVFAVMAATPQHTYQLLTKRHGRMRALLTSATFRALVRDDLQRRCGASRRSDLGVCPACQMNATGNCAAETIEQWPLPNLHVGVSVEDQAAADLRIDVLLDTPAAVRWVSLEPMVGPVDLDGRVDRHGGRPKLTYWLTGRPGWATEGEPVGRSGLTLHAPTTGPRLDWVVVGGEDGPRARPMHPDWPRLIRDQCRRAGVPFLFKQWGAWSPLAPLTADGAFDFRGRHTLADDGTLYEPGALTYEPEGPRYREALHADHQRARLTAMYRVGKKAAGRLLDGVEHDEYPPAAAA